MLDLSLDRPAAPAKDAATLVLVRDGEGGLDVFCVERNKKSRFVGGAVVFPGGKVDASDAEPAWLSLVTPPRAERATDFAADDVLLRALAIASVRESLEEAAILHVSGGAVDDAAVRALRDRHASEPSALARFLTERRLRLDLAALHPLARWVTPEAEARRYDTRFFLAIAPVGQHGAHDAHETTASFWATPAEVLRRFDAGEVQLVPPTHRTLELLASCRTTAEAIALAAASSKQPICPRLVPQADTLALTLPGDPEHPLREARIAGSSRYVLRGERWLAEDAPR